MFSVVKCEPYERIIKDPIGRLIKVIFDDSGWGGENLALEIVGMLNQGKTNEKEEK